MRSLIGTFGKWLPATGTRMAPKDSVCAVTTFNARVHKAGFSAASEKADSTASRSHTPM